METPSLFEDTRYQPLADRLRPTHLASYVGQSHLVGEGQPLRRVLDEGHLHSMIFWGPPGVGKTTLARLIAQHCQCHWLSLSAVLSGVKDIRQAVDLAKTQAKRTVLFVDEVHRFNKAQQDAFLPYVEDGTLTFIGATTENPSFELNAALLSRARVYLLKPLQNEDLQKLLERALEDSELGLGNLQLKITEPAARQLMESADGDARRLLNLLEIAADLVEPQAMIDEAVLATVVKHSWRRFDKGGEQFYDQISALHKSVRGSAPDAALYWFTRMLDGGCDPLYIARRVVRMASEDVGNADPKALQLALNAWDVQQRLGSPEGELAIAQAILYCASVPKSNAVYQAFKAAMSAVRDQGSYPVPLHLRNAPTQLMSDIGYGDGYRYAHDEPHAYAAGENYFPEGMTPEEYYTPKGYGLEAKIKQRLEFLASLDDAAKKGADS